MRGNSLGFSGAQAFANKQRSFFERRRKSSEKRLAYFKLAVLWTIIVRQNHRAEAIEVV